MTDPSDVSWIRVIFAFSFVLALVAGLGGVLKYLSMRGLSIPVKGAKAKRLALVETLPLDAKRRCVIVRCDDREHLLLLGEQNDIVVDTNLSPSNTP